MKWDVKFNVLLQFYLIFCGADVNVKVSVWCKSLLFNFSLSGERSVMDHGWVLVMAFQLTGGAAGVQGHRVVGVCAAVSATITIHDSTMPWWWPHPLCVWIMTNARLVPLYSVFSQPAKTVCYKKCVQSFTVTRVVQQQTSMFTSFISLIE